jgi:hypothetical protein
MTGKLIGLQHEQPRAVHGIVGLCHLLEAPHWPAARSVARQDIDTYLHEAGPKWADRRQALDLLMEEFARRSG